MTIHGRSIQHIHLEIVKHCIFEMFDQAEMVTNHKIKILFS